MSANVGAATWIRGAVKAGQEPSTEVPQADADLIALVREARSGSETAFTALFERFQSPIVNYIYRLVDDWETANDLAQDTFIKAYKALPRTDDALQISPWLYRIATNTALDALRRRKRITWLPFNADVEIPNPYPDTAHTQAQNDLIQRSLLQVSPDQRIALVLNMYHGFAYKEIAEMLGISVNLVAVRIFRGREKFIDAYKKASEND